jgi:hypothetical protein
MMNLYTGILWMFIGSIIHGIFINPMNILAYDYNHLYFSSKTLQYSAIYMASNMALLEIMMFYSSHGTLPNIFLIPIFLSITIICIYLLRNQVFISDEDWLKRMISHHSTALTTSKS